MSEQIREQVSAFLDGELPDSETELLLKRLTRDGELRESFGRYALIGEAIRGGSLSLTTKRFAGRVNFAIDGEPIPVDGQAPQIRSPRWWRPLAGGAVAAGVAAVALVTFQQRADAPALQPRLAAAGNAAVSCAAAEISSPLNMFPNSGESTVYHKRLPATRLCTARQPPPPAFRDTTI